MFIARLLGWIGDAQSKDERDGCNPTGGVEIFPISSCPALCRASTSFLLRALEGVDGRVKPGHDGSPRLLLTRLRTLRLAVAHQPVEMHADVGSLRRGVGERDGAVECHAGFFIAAKLHQEGAAHAEDRKSTRLNSSHEWTSYAVFCL